MPKYSKYWPLCQVFGIFSPRTEAVRFFDLPTKLDTIIPMEDTPGQRKNLVAEQMELNAAEAWLRTSLIGLLSPKEIFERVGRLKEENSKGGRTPHAIAEDIVNYAYRILGDH